MLGFLKEAMGLFAGVTMFGMVAGVAVVATFVGIIACRKNPSAVVKVVAVGMGSLVFVMGFNAHVEATKVKAAVAAKKLEVESELAKKRLEVESETAKKKLEVDSEVEKKRLEVETEVEKKALGRKTCTIHTPFLDIHCTPAPTTPPTPAPEV